MPYSALQPDRLIATIATLRDRIRERFPTASLGGVAEALLGIATAHAERSQRIRRPIWWLRALSFGLVLASIASLVLLGLSIRVRDEAEWPLSELVQTLEAGLSMLFFLGAGAVFLFSLELRAKRRRCLEAVHELRAMAHIVDMHQLTKDPEHVLHGGPDTASSPARTLSRFELSRYLDYCSEMLSLMGKVAALYAQGFPDPQAVAAVDDIEDLTTGLARKIWQKIMILENAAAAPAAAAHPATPPAPPSPPHSGPAA
ncbi:MAG: hypothetical protein JNL08_03100 [Planctomycetes bacterium]|nr:hypothetical protein [Planctomycetota bacterium]